MAYGPRLEITEDGSDPLVHIAKEELMSEYQHVAFRAIDGPLNEENLEFMRRQSSRADITPRSFDNEYHFGDFRGDAAEMLRRGYDLHLHYANFGIRKLMIRLPHGLPDAKAAKAYFEEDALEFVKDRRGQGGILTFDPFYEAGQLEELWDIDQFLDRLVPLRAEIIEGDLRPLYLGHLAVACDDNHDPEEMKVSPIPAGLKKLSDAQRALVELYGLDEDLVAAAARHSPSVHAQSEARNQYAAWLHQQPEARKDGWLARLMTEHQSTVRRDIVAKFKGDLGAPSWPVIRIDRTIAELKTAAEETQRKATRKAADSAAQKPAKSRRHGGRAGATDS
jgi:hypothetical protein